MKTGVLQFCENYAKKLKSDEDFKVNPRTWQDYRDEYSFTLSVKTHCPMVIMGQYSSELITLDDEDLKYLYDKYSKKLEEEMKQNLLDVQKAYDKLEPLP